jgi:hypothetical protein
MTGMPRMNIGEMLGSMMGGVTALGWMAHFMMGAGFFSGSLVAAIGSLMGHLVYGAAMGTVYGQSDRVSVGQALHADA